MPLKQTTFDFDFGTEDTAPEKKPAVNPVAEESVVEIEIKSAPKKSTRGRMKISDMKASADKVEIPSDEILFQKSYYSIGSVSDMFAVNPSLIRFWENEFSILKPKKNAKGDRFFRPEDVKNLKLIYHLLRERKYTIDGAKDFLKMNKKASEKYETIESLKELRGFLIELKTNL